MSNPTQNPSPAELARTDAVTRVMELEGVTAVFPPTLALVRSLTTHNSAPHEALRLSAGTGPTEALIDIAVASGHRAADVAAAVQALIHSVLSGHGIEVASVAVTVLEHGVPTAPAGSAAGAGPTP